MPSTHTSLRYHLVFSTKDRLPLIRADIRDRLHALMGGIVKALDGVKLQIGGTYDHAHLLVGLKPTHRLSDFLCRLKGDSSKWVHDELGNRRFAWQEGYGAFSVSKSDVLAVREYIRTQEDHHRHRTFQEEYRQLLIEEGIEFDERFLW